MSRDNSSALDAYLGTQRAEGETVQESSEFTIEASLAWEKMAAHALPFPQAWVLKLVQAAVAGGGVSIQVTQSREHTTLRLHGLNGWSREILEKALFDFTAEGPRFAKHLALGLRALSKTVNKPFKVYYPPRSPWITWNGENLEHHQEGPSTSDILIVEIQNLSHDHKTGFMDWLTNPGREFSAAVSSALATHCYTCPIDLRVDGRPINGLHNEPEYSASSNTRPLLLLHGKARPPLLSFRRPLEGGALNGEGPTVRMGSAQSSLPVDKTIGWGGLLAAFLRVKKESATYFSKEKVRRYYPAARNSYIAWVRDGVVVEKEKIACCSVGLLLVVETEGLATDITGFGLKKDEAYQERRRALLKRVANKLEGIAAEIDVGRQSAGLNFALQTVLGAVGFLLFPPLGFFVLADVGYHYHQFSKLEKSMEVEFSEGFVELFDTLKSLGRG